MLLKPSPDKLLLDAIVVMPGVPRWEESASRSCSVALVVPSLLFKWAFPLSETVCETDNERFAAGRVSCVDDDVVLFCTEGVTDSGVVESDSGGDNTTAGFTIATETGPLQAGRSRSRSLALQTHHSTPIGECDSSHASLASIALNELPISIMSGNATPNAVCDRVFVK